MQTLLRLGHATTRCHVHRVQKVGVTVVELTTDLGHTTRGHSTECLLLTSCHITKNTNVFRENVLLRAHNCHRRLAKDVVSWAVGILGRHVDRLKLGKDVTDLETFLQIVVLVGINQLQEFTAMEDNGMVLVVRLAVTQNRVARQLDTELGTTTTSGEHLAVAINQRRVPSRLAALLGRWFFIQVGNQQIRVRTQQEFSVLNLFLVETRVALHRNYEFKFSVAHAFQFLLEALGVTTEQLHNFRVLDTVQQLDGLVVVHKATHRSVQRLCTQRRPNSRTQCVFWRSRLETNAIERQIICLAALEIRLFVFKAKRSIACKVA